MPITEDLNLQEAHFGAEPFGYDHARETGNLCRAICATMGMEGDMLLAARAVGMFHDLGRNIEGQRAATGIYTQNRSMSGQLIRQNGGKVSKWTEKHPQHAEESADLARDALLGDVNFVATGLIDLVCRVIAQHSIHGPPPTEPLARALYDADLLESARFRPFYKDDVAMFERFYHGRVSRVVTEFAKNPVVQARWKMERGVAKVAKAPEVDPNAPKASDVMQKVMANRMRNKG